MWGLQGSNGKEDLRIRKGHWGEHPVPLDGPPAAALGYAQEFDGTRDSEMSHSLLVTLSHQLHSVDGRLAQHSGQQHTTQYGPQGRVINQGKPRWGWLLSLFWLLLKLLPSSHYLCTAGMHLHVPERAQQIWKSLEYMSWIPSTAC